jgi:hypothetical protein
VTNFYKQNVYDPSDNKIGDVDDVLIDKEGRVTARSSASADFSVWATKTLLFHSAPCAPARK